MVATVAIVGRPNVGKSTLFNRLLGRHLALVDKMPGLTRDRREGETGIGNARVNFIDTAGLEDAEEGTLQARMLDQTRMAIAGADILLFMLDARAGVTPADEDFANLARASGKPVILVANKCEGRAGEAGYYEAFSLGLGEPIAISAEHGEGIGELLAAIGQAAAVFGDTAGTPSQEQEEKTQETDQPVRVAVVGRPNAGKSTLVNALLGEERVITGPEPGITRDSIAVGCEWKGREVKLFDTAGLRRKARVEKGAETLSVEDTLRAIRFAEVVVLLVDAQAPFEKQDLQIADLVAQEGRALVIAVSKWDLETSQKARIRELEAELERLLPQIRDVPLVPVSALRGTGLAKLMNAVFAVYEVWNRRVPTAALNRWLEEAVEHHPPPAVRGRRIRMRFMTQPNARPPTFVVFCSRPRNVPEAYRRYLVQGLREAFDLPGVPVRLNLRKGKNPYAS